MARKTIVISGGSDGIGKAAATRLASSDHHVVILGRDREKTEAAALEIGAKWHIADFERLDDVYAVAHQLLALYPRIDVLANNAGMISTFDRRVTVDGHEVTFQVNYLASFLLTQLLLPRLIDSRATVIFTSSMMHHACRLDLDDLEHVHQYDPITAYSESKLAMILCAKELARRHAKDGVVAAAFHPGRIASHFAHQPGAALKWLFEPPASWFWLSSVETGADSLVFLAEQTSAMNGAYVYRRKQKTPSAQARDPELARILWEKSTALVAKWTNHSRSHSEPR